MGISRAISPGSDVGMGSWETLVGSCLWDHPAANCHPTVNLSLSGSNKIMLILFKGLFQKKKKKRFLV